MSSEESSSYSESDSDSEPTPIKKGKSVKESTSKKRKLRSSTAPKSTLKKKVLDKKSHKSKSKSKKIQPAGSDGIPVTQNYAPNEKPVPIIDFNGYLGNGWYLRISRWEKGSRRQYICLGQFDDAGVRKFGANLPLELAEVFTKSVNDMYAAYVAALE